MVNGGRTRLLQVAIDKAEHLVMGKACIKNMHLIVYASLQQ